MRLILQSAGFIHFCLEFDLFFLLIEHAHQFSINLFVLFVDLLASSVSLELKGQHSDLLLLLLEHSHVLRLVELFAAIFMGILECVF